MTYGPPECRVRWHDDPEPYDIGDAENPEDVAHYVDTYGVAGCVVELCPPACACCGAKQWHVAESLWSIVGDAAYHRFIELELQRSAVLA